jgi:hypothetical protein
MIQVKEFPDKQFESKEDLFKALRENKSKLIATKKMVTKIADPITASIGDKTASKNIDGNPTSLNVKSVINTTNLFDSHGDVHINGIWNKSAKEKKNLMLLQEHKMAFDHIISDDVDASVKSMTWKELGYNFSGTTEALVFESKLDAERNSYMFNQYAKGYVKNHSVGMRYVKLDLAINSEAEWNKEEKEIWDKYYPDIANKEEVDEVGYFWAVTEAKIIEGSAVPVGSNWATPTISTEAVTDTSKNEPSEDTQRMQRFINNLKI